MTFKMNKRLSIIIVLMILLIFISSVSLFINFFEFKDSNEFVCFQDLEDKVSECSHLSQSGMTCYPNSNNYEDSKRCKSGWVYVGEKI